MIALWIKVIQFYSSVSKLAYSEKLVGTRLKMKNSLWLQSPPGNACVHLRWSSDCLLAQILDKFPGNTSDVSRILNVIQDHRLTWRYLNLVSNKNDLNICRLEFQMSLIAKISIHIIIETYNYLVWYFQCNLKLLAASLSAPRKAKSEDLRQWRSMKWITFLRQNRSVLLAILRCVHRHHFLVLFVCAPSNIICLFGTFCF